MVKVNKERMKWAMPILALAVIYCVFTFMTYPVIKIAGASTLVPMLVISTFISSMIVSIMIGLFIKVETDNVKEQMTNIGIQLAYALGLALIIGLTSTAIVCGITGVNIDQFKIASFLAFASFALQAVFIGSINWFGKKGIAIPVSTLALGMSTAALPAVMLPDLWRYGIASWAPQRYMADGLRSLTDIPGYSFDAPMIAIAIAAVIGIVVLLSAIYKPVIAKRIAFRKEQGDT